MWSEKAKRPRKGYFCILFDRRTAFAVLLLLFIFRGTAPTDPHQKLKSVGVQPLGFGKGWSPSQGRNSASSKEKFAYIKRNKSVSPNTKRTKQQIKKPHAEKKQ